MRYNRTSAKKKTWSERQKSFISCLWLERVINLFHAREQLAHMCNEIYGAQQSHEKLHVFFQKYEYKKHNFTSTHTMKRFLLCVTAVYFITFEVFFIIENCRAKQLNNGRWSLLWAARNPGKYISIAIFLTAFYLSAVISYQLPLKQYKKCSPRLSVSTARRFALHSYRTRPAMRKCHLLRHKV